MNAQAAVHVVSSDVPRFRTKNGVSTLDFQRVLGLNRFETTWLWLHQTRRSLMCPGRDRLRCSVVAVSVVVDDTYARGYRKDKDGRIAGQSAEGKVLVLNMAEK